MRERVIDRHQHRMDALEKADILAAILLALGHGDQAHAITECRSFPDIGGEHMADAGDVHGGEIDFRAEGQAGEDRQLVRGVDAVDVEGRVRLGIAFRLCLLQHIGKGAAIPLHGREDVIAGAVENAVDPHDPVGRSPFPQALDDRHAARDRCFIFERHARPLRFAGEIEPVMRDHRLIGGHERLALAKALACQGESRAIRAADELDDGVDVVSPGQRAHVVHPLVAREIDAAILVAISRRDGDDLDRPTGTSRDQLPIGFQQANDPRAHRSKTDDGEAKRGGGVHECLFL